MSTPPTDQPATVPPTEESTTVSEPVQATSEANVKATSLDHPAMPHTEPTELTSTASVTIEEPNLDVKAADTTTGEASGAEVIAPGDADGDNTASKKNDKKRRSSGVPEHKSKKLNRKKSQATLHLEAKPGDYYFARLKGYPPWPAIICDESMLPESLLGTRPVTAARPDGTYREDYQEDGKNVKDRTYAVMYLHTNEFSWIANSDLDPIDMDQLKEETQGKKGKTLWAAYELAKEGHDIQYFKDLLEAHEKAMRDAYAELDRKDAEKAAKEEKKQKRLSEAATKKTVKEDVDMEDVSEKKKSKKRKNEDAEEAEKPAKTPKTKLKVNLKTNGESSSKRKPRAKAPAQPEMTEEERCAKREKEVLFFRHKLQKGFLTTDRAPQEDEMHQMGEYFNNLEQYKDLEPTIIRNTKIHKVLKAIIKIASIPQDEVFKFKDRSMQLLQTWQTVLNSEQPGPSEGGADVKELPVGDTAKPSTAESPAAEKPTANGTTEDEAADEGIEGKPEEPTKDTEASESNDDGPKATESIIEAKTAGDATDGDTSMVDALKEEAADGTSTDQPQAAPAEVSAST